MLGMDFAAKLEKLLAEKGWDKATLADRVGVSNNAAGRWVNGDGRPFKSVVVRLARELGVSLDYLLDDEIDAPAPALSAEDRVVLKLFQRSGLTIEDVMDLLTRETPPRDKQQRLRG